MSSKRRNCKAIEWLRHSLAAEPFSMTRKKRTHCHSELSEAKNPVASKHLIANMIQAKKL